MIESILKYSELTCGIILLIFAIIQITYKNRQLINLNIAGLFFCLSYVILSLWTFKSGIIFHVPWLMYTDIAMAFAIGPFVYFYLRSVLGFKIKTGIPYLINFIPAFIVYAVIIINNIMNDCFSVYYSANPSVYPVYHLSPVVRIIDFISNFFMITYFISATKNIHIYLKKGSHKPAKELHIIFYYMFFILLFSGMMLSASVTGSNTLNITAIYLLTLSGVWYFIFSFRYPEFTQKAIKEARTIRYQNTMLAGIDPAAVLGRLDELMEEEKLYTDYELTLPKLSTELMITPHQLSKILNSERKINFRGLLNSYRVKESMKQMAEYPDRTILDIALASGVNSKSSFNSVFLKSTGQTPTDYRESLKG
jgi:AraC-like DNA-binding protein